jgi:hypothetical protein
MSERQVTIKLGVEDNIGDRLLEIRKQRDALLGKSKINLSVSASGLDNAQRAMADARKTSNAATRDLSTLGNSITSKAIAPLAEYQKLLGSAMQVCRTFGAAAVTGLRGASAEFQKQKTLAAFWGTSGYLGQGMSSFKGSISSFLSSGGAGFTSWMKNSTSAIAEYRLALVGASAVLVGFAAVAAMKSKTTANLITSTLDTRLMTRKLTDQAGARAWIEGAQKDDWSGGRAERLGVFQTVLSKNPRINQATAQKRTEDIEKYFFANQEMLKNKGIASAEALASKISAPQLVGDDATMFEDIFGLGFSKLMPEARLARLSTEAPGNEQMEKAVAARPDVVMEKRLNAMTASIGDSVLPVLNDVLGTFLQISDVIGSIPGLGPMIGWGAVLTGAATGGLVIVGMLGSLIPGLEAMYALTKADTVAKIANTVATTGVTAAQWLLNAAMTANPLGIAIMAIVGLIAILYVLEKKFGVVSKAWAVFSNSGVGKGIFAQLESAKKLVSDIGSQFMKGNSGGAIKMVLEAVAMATPIGMLIKLTLFMVDFMRKLWANSSALNKLFSNGLAIWQSLIDFLVKIRDSISNLPKGISEAIWGKGGQNPPDMNKMGTKALANAPANASDQELSDYAMKMAREFYPSSSYSDEQLKPLANDIYDMLKSKGTNEEQRNIDRLNARTPIIPQDQTSGSNVVNIASKKYGDKLLKTGDQFLATKAMGNPLDTYGAVLSSMWNSVIGNSPKMAAGGPITTSGSIIGHGGEQITPASVVQGGKTTLERINEMVSGGSMARGAAPISVGSVSVNVHIDRIEKGSDVDGLLAKISDQAADKLLFALRNKLDNLSQRGIAYQRA